MILVAVILVLALGAGWLAGGAVGNLARLRLRGTRLIFAALGLQVLLLAVDALGGPAAALGRPLMAISLLAVVAFLLANRTLPAVPVILVGFAANALVIVLNGAMPVSPDALAAIGAAAEVGAGKHELLDAATRLSWLADVIPLAPLRTVVSLGDLVLAAGVGLLVVGQMRRYPPRPGRQLPPRPVPPLSRPRRRTPQPGPDHLSGTPPG